MPRFGSGSWGRQKPPPGSVLLRSDPLARAVTRAWLFSEGGGPGRDSAAGEVAAVTGSVPWAATPWGVGRSFVAGGNHVDLDASQLLSSPFSAVFGVVSGQAGVSQDGQTVFSLGTAGSLFSLYFAIGAGHPSLYTASSSAWFDGSGGIPVGVPVVTGFTVSGSTKTVYAGGVTRASVTSGSAYSPGAPSAAQLGYRVDGGGFPQFLGSIAFAFFFAAALSDADHARLAVDPFSLFAPPPGRRFFMPAAAAPALSYDWLQAQPPAVSSPPRVIPY